MAGLQGQGFLKLFAFLRSPSGKKRVGDIEKKVTEILKSTKELELREQLTVNKVYKINFSYISQV